MKKGICKIVKRNSRLNQYIDKLGQADGYKHYLEEKVFIKNVGAVKGRTYSDLSKNLLYKNIGLYNKKTGYSHSVEFKQVSPTSWKVDDITIRLKAVNPELKQQRIEDRLEGDKVFSNLEEKSNNNLKELQKVEEVDTMQEMRLSMLRDFDNFYPQYADLTTENKIILIDQMSNGELETYC